MACGGRATGTELVQRDRDCATPVAGRQQCSWRGLASLQCPRSTTWRIRFSAPRACPAAAMSISLAAAVEAIKAKVDVVGPTLKGAAAVKTAMAHLEMTPCGRLKTDVQAVCTRLEIKTGWAGDGTATKKPPAEKAPAATEAPAAAAAAPSLWTKDVRTKPATTIQTMSRGRGARKAYKARKKREVARRHIVKEMYTTEVTYNGCLTTLDQFIAQLRFQATMAGSPAHSPKPAKGPKGRRASVQGMAWQASVSGKEAAGFPSNDDIQKMFANVTDFVDLSNQLLEGLETRVGEGACNWTPSGRVSDIFAELASGETVYAQLWNVRSPVPLILRNYLQLLPCNHCPAFTAITVPLSQGSTPTRSTRRSLRRALST